MLRKKETLLNNDVLLALIYILPNDALRWMTENSQELNYLSAYLFVGSPPQNPKRGSQLKRTKIDVRVAIEQWNTFARQWDARLPMTLPTRWRLRSYYTARVRCSSNVY